jgi:hypothetical protein
MGKRGQNNLKGRRPNNVPDSARKILRISKTFLKSAIISTSLTLLVGIALWIIFRPYRYTGRVSEIYNELNCPVPTFPEFDPRVNYRVDENGVKLPEWEARGMYAQECDRKRELAKKEWEEKLPKNLIFGGTRQFFEYCDNSDGIVIWNPEDIGGSIESRQNYLLARIKAALLIVFAACFTIVYIVLYFRKHPVKIVIE